MAQLSLAQRYKIESGLDQKLTKEQISKIINKNKSTVGREIQRNSDDRNGRYTAELAHRKAMGRHKNKTKKIRFTPEIRSYVRAQIGDDLSPEQIVGKAKKDSIACVSHERIYQFIWKDKKHGGKLYKHLRNQGKRYRKRGQSKDTRGLIKGRVSIDQRPNVVEEKQRLGDLEIDLIIGKGHKQALLTINDRASGYLLMDKVESKEAIEIERKTIALLEDWKPLIHTITSDNGREFANHQNIADQLMLNFYFADAYKSWQRGANENLNGLVRQYFTKNYDFNTITKEQIIQVQNKLNNRPRKRFGFKNPKEVFAEKLDQLKDVAFIT